MDSPIKSGNDSLKYLFSRHSRAGGNPDTLLLKYFSILLRMNLNFSLLICLIPDKHNVCNHLLAVVIRFGDAPDTVTVSAYALSDIFSFDI